jgi:6,7-dimethyl-8-ribityllumazine synthase
MKTIEGQLVASGLKFAVVVARFNSFLTEHLKEGAIDTIVRHGGSREDISVVYVPGSYEIPLACRSLAQSKRYDAVVALGAVIKGATSHYDLVCSEVSKGISSVMLQTGVPIGFGVITVDSIEQGIERSGTKAGNKGVDAAIAAIEMTNLLRTLG